MKTVRKVGRTLFKMNQSSGGYLAILLPAIKWCLPA
jgi:hypothetical protein